MTESSENEKGPPRPDNVTDLPEKGRETRSAGTVPKSRGWLWKLSTLVLLVLLLLSAGFNMFQQKLLDGETSHYANLVVTETARADAAEQEALELRELVGGVHTNMSALHEALSQLLASTGQALGVEEEAVPGDDQAAPGADVP